MVQRERGSFPFRHCIFLTRRTHQRGLPPGGTERDEMQPRTEWIINVKISFPTESNKLPMIWLSERLVGRIRETPGSRGGMSSPPRVIDSCAVSTFLVVVIKGARARHGARSLAPSGRVTGPHRKPILGDLCPEHRAVVNPPSSVIWKILIALLMRNSGCWELPKSRLDRCFFFSVAYFCL